MEYSDCQKVLSYAHEQSEFTTNKLLKGFELLYEAHHCEYENHVQIIRRFINSFSKLCTMKTEEIKIDKKNRKKRKETFEIGDN